MLLQRQNFLFFSNIFALLHIYMFSVVSSASPLRKNSSFEHSDVNKTVITTKIACLPSRAGRCTWGAAHRMGHNHSRAGGQRLYTNTAALYCRSIYHSNWCSSKNHGPLMLPAPLQPRNMCGYKMLHVWHRVDTEYVLWCRRRGIEKKG